ncbi:MAG: 50S ribosomal protein L25/general stress protein Ctc [Gammaproteobacteria bacterium]|nr:50S ribosomal protein L25/general stress protein Ctc [Gammaproteobacteria bacterium]
MSNVDFSLTATSRSDQGKGASRRLRRNGNVPAVIYGGDREPAAITLEHHILANHLEQEAFYSHILNLTIDGRSEQVVLKDLQRHPAKPFILHADFLRIKSDEKIRMTVPLHFSGEEVAPGVKIDGGMISHNITEVEISCLPKDLPEYIAIDLSHLTMEHAFHLSEIKLPDGVELLELSHGEEHDLPVAAVHKTRAAVDTEEGSDEGEGEETTE